MIKRLRIYKGSRQKNNSGPSTKRGNGGKGRATKKKELFLSSKKKSEKKWQLSSSGAGCRATIFFAASLICEASLSNDISILNLQGGEYHGYLIKWLYRVAIIWNIIYSPLWNIFAHFNFYYKKKYLEEIKKSTSVRNP